MGRHEGDAWARAEDLEFLRSLGRWISYVSVPSRVEQLSESERS